MTNAVEWRFKYLSINKALFMNALALLYDVDGIPAPHVQPSPRELCSETDTHTAGECVHTALVRVSVISEWLS